MPIASPCIKLCILDEASGLCQGCGRTLAEIAGWGTLPESERLAVMASLKGRLDRSRAARLAVSHRPASRRGVTQS